MNSANGEEHGQMWTHVGTTDHGITWNLIMRYKYHNKGPCTQNIK